MPFAKRPLVAIVVLIGAGLAGCGSSSQPSIPSSARVVGATPTSPGQIILSQLGAQRIGLRTSAAQAVPVAPPIVKTTIVHGTKTTTTIPAAKPSAGVSIPYAAIIYDASGKAYTFTNTAPLTYTEVPVTVDHITGNSVYLSAGPKPGVKIVTVGAEELYGVQTGVLAQS
jgi:hypothetical protein